jgi:hypothetical protein
VHVKEATEEAGILFHKDAIRPAIDQDVRFQRSVNSHGKEGVAQSTVNCPRAASTFAHFADRKESDRVQNEKCSIIWTGHVDQHNRTRGPDAVEGPSTRSTC